MQRQQLARIRSFSFSTVILRQYGVVEKIACGVRGRTTTRDRGETLFSLAAISGWITPRKVFLMRSELPTGQPAPRKSMAM